MFDGKNTSTGVSSERVFVEANVSGFGVSTETTKTKDVSGKQGKDMKSYINSPIIQEGYDVPPSIQKYNNWLVIVKK